MLKDKFVISFFAALCILYAVFHLSPSSYGYVLQKLGFDNSGLLMGTPQPIRSDEHSVVTPTFQVCVNNHFERYNTTSPYGEDLRTNLSFPLKDWGLIFKPYFAFFLLNPAIGYSAYWGFFYFLFFAGYYLLFRCFKLSEILSICGSLGIFSTSFVQCWWTSFGPHLAVIPWIYLSLKIHYNYFGKLLLCSYLLSCWLILFFYPGFILIHSILILALLYSTSRDRNQFIKNSVIFAFSALFAGGIAFLYLYDWLKLISATDLGARSYPGGQVSWLSLLSMLYPKLAYSGYETLRNIVNLNTCELSAVGSLIFLAAFVFAWDGLLQAIKKNNVLLILVAMVICWMVFPIPNVVGKILLLDKLPGGRLSFAIGLPAFILALEAFEYTRNKINISSIFCFYILLLLGLCSKFVFYEIDLSQYQDEAWISIFTIFSLCIFYLLSQKLAFFNRNIKQIFVTTVTVFSALYFIGFNPVQSTKNIFQKNHNQTTANFDLLQSNHPSGWLVVSGFHGSILNGLGYKSISHTLYSPQPHFFEWFKSEMPSDEFNKVFNRWGYIQLNKTVTKPELPVDIVILLPESAFLK